MNKYRWSKTVGPKIHNDVTPTAEDVKDVEHQISAVNEEILKIGLKVYQGKTKFMTNINTTDNILDRNRDYDEHGVSQKH